ncbi:hypothetical protein [Xanthomonas arboricola]|nr:hypothetical protein [Xanthomonas arboricola]
MRPRVGGQSSRRFSSNVCCGHDRDRGRISERSYSYSYSYSYSS